MCEITSFVLVAFQIFIAFLAICNGYQKLILLSKLYTLHMTEKTVPDCRSSIKGAQCIKATLNPSASKWKL